MFNEKNWQKRWFSDSKYIDYLCGLFLEWNLSCHDQSIFMAILSYYLGEVFFCAHMSICFSVAISVRLLLIELYNVWFTSLQQQRENMNENGEKITHSVWMNINCTFTCCIWPLLHNDVAMAVVLVFFSCLHSFIQPFHFLTRQ